MCSYIRGVDDELWDIVEDGTNFEVDEEGMMADRKKLTITQKKIYKKHHKVREIWVDVLPHVEYMKIGDKSTAKVIFESLFSTYGGNHHVKEAKTNQMVHQSELFKMTEDEDIETMYSRF
jgi:hypothetical protein